VYAVVYMAVSTNMYTAVYGPCTPTQAVYTFHAQRITSIFFAEVTIYAETYIQKKLGQLALLVPCCGGQQYYVQCS